MKKGFNTRLFKGALVLAVAVVVAVLVFFVLAATGVIGINPFKIGFAILTLGIGGIFALYGIIVKGGYELAVGGILLIIGITIVLIGVLAWWIIVIIDAVLILLALLSLFLLKADMLVPERTDEKPDYKPYSETLAEKKAEREEKEKDEQLPEIKDYSDKQ